MVAKYSLHIAVNETDQSAYPEPFEALSACVNDAAAFEALAEAQHFEAQRLYDREATADAVLANLHALSIRMQPGDLLFLTYSGHGSQGPDLDHDEPDDQLDETWVLHDRQLFDDELWLSWSRFQPGVYIFLVSDSCNSGTVARVAPQVVAIPYSPGQSRGAGAPARTRSRKLPGSARAQDFKERSALYGRVKAQLPQPETIGTAATLLLFAACQDGEDANEVDGHGVMTRAFLDSWEDGEFSGGYFDLFQRLAKRVHGQTPNYLPLGQEDPDFERRRPLTAVNEIR